MTNQKLYISTVLTNFELYISTVFVNWKLYISTVLKKQYHIYEYSLGILLLPWQDFHHVLSLQIVLYTHRLSWQILIYMPRLNFLELHISRAAKKLSCKMSHKIRSCFNVKLILLLLGVMFHCAGSILVLADFQPCSFSITNKC